MANEAQCSLPYNIFWLKPYKVKKLKGLKKSEVEFYLGKPEEKYNSDDEYCDSFECWSYSFSYLPERGWRGGGLFLTLEIGKNKTVKKAYWVMTQ